MGLFSFSMLLNEMSSLVPKSLGLNDFERSYDHSSFGMKNVFRFSSVRNHLSLYQLTKFSIFGINKFAKVKQIC